MIVCKGYREGMGGGQKGHNFKGAKTESFDGVKGFYDFWWSGFFGGAFEMNRKVWIFCARC